MASEDNKQHDHYTILLQRETSNQVELHTSLAELYCELKKDERLLNFTKSQVKHVFFYAGMNCPFEVFTIKVQTGKSHSEKQ